MIFCDSSGWFPVHDATVGTPVERLCLDGHLSADQVALSPDLSLLVVTTTAKANGSGFQLVLYCHSESSGGTMEWKVRDSISLGTGKVEYMAWVLKVSDPSH